MFEELKKHNYYLRIIIKIIIGDSIIVVLGDKCSCVMEENMVVFR